MSLMRAPDSLAAGGASPGTAGAGWSAGEPTGLQAGSARCLPLFRRGGWYDSLDREPVLAAPGSALLSQAPPVLLRDDAGWLRRSFPRPPLAPPAPGTAGRGREEREKKAAAAGPWRPERDERARLVARAMELFAGGAAEAAETAAGGTGRRRTPLAPVASGDVNTFDAFERDLDRHCGLPPALTRRWTALLASQAARLAVAAAAGGELPPGTLALVSLPANTFVCLEAVLELALRGAAVWLRPSRREPFAALRLVACLLAAGWPRHLLGLYPTSRQALGALVRLADLAVLYGGPGLAAELASLSGPRIEVRGPGRARAVVAETCTAAAAVGPLLALVAGDSGRFCTSVGTILCADGAEAIGRQLAPCLDDLPLAPPGPAGEWSWPLASWPEEAPARATAAWIEERLRPGDRVLTRRALLQWRDGRLVLAPTLVALASPDGHPLLGVELPFPFAVVAGAQGAPGAPDGENALLEAPPGASVPPGGTPVPAASLAASAASSAGVRPELLAGARFVHVLGAGGSCSLIDVSARGGCL
jgi:Aldehyde dehydrogenase family